MEIKKRACTDCPRDKNGYKIYSESHFNSLGFCKKNWKVSKKAS